ncbi:ROK family transcriptional regulator [Aquabacterium sp. A7-Y]|uniref:ROK family transcriptional regulator n=1 Tax=Aquabacterium sp. A7-Y TaxID=1349605 RepID=UPI00223D2F74|nr:ROK family transcriptional regulator [Aquabacterium sp. A7-Y]MCW7539781.1 ROK family transcriptional regulator [Aquabacterium sp. A7-Y]
MARLQARLISQLHLYQVLHAVRLARGPISRAEICLSTGLSQAAVSGLTRRLIEDGALVEVGARPSAGGRRERELAINADFAWVLGVKAAMHQLTMALADFAGGVRHTLTLPLQAPLAPAALITEIAGAIDRCLNGAPAPAAGRLAGVGLALPGFVDSLADVLLWSPVLDAGSPRVEGLGRSLSELLKVPVFIENDANMLALAQQWFGPAAGVGNAALVTLEHGVGLGLIINGELYRGHAGLASELGHLQVVPGGQPCRCGKSGCLEAYVAHYAVVREGRVAGLLPPADGRAPADDTEQAYRTLAAQAREGNPQAVRIFERQGRWLGQWIGNVVNLLSPQAVILGGGGTSAYDLYQGALHEAMQDAMALPHRGRVRLTVMPQGDEVWAQGAASLVLQRLDESAETLASVSRHGLLSDTPSHRERPDA